MLNLNGKCVLFYAGYVCRWVLSQAKKDGADDDIAKYDGKWQIELVEAFHLHFEFNYPYSISSILTVDRRVASRGARRKCSHW